MMLEGKGFFTWKIPKCENGDAGQIAAHANAAGLTHMLLKVADGTVIYNGTWGDPVDYTTPVVNALRAKGIKVWGWHYIYGDYPASEANVAIARIRQYNLDGYVLDVEGEYKEPGKKSAASQFMIRLREACPEITIALSSYRFPSLHPQVPWTEFLEHCDLNMPQVYWLKAHNPADQLERSVEELQVKKPSLPVVPTGAAFREYGWQPTEGEVQEFFDKAKELNLAAVNFWEWSDARSGIIPGVWDTIKNYQWSGSTGTRDICQVLVDAMNSHNVDKIVELYGPPAIHISNLRTTQGLENLRTWYNQLFNEILPNSKFKIGNFSGKGSSRHFTWSASSAKGFVRNGADTLGISKGKIGYHYSFFRVSK